MLRLMRFAFAAMFVVVVTAAARADETPTAAPSQRQEVLALFTRMETLFADADAKGLATCWTASGEFVGPGGAGAEGRENIEKLFQDAFAARKDGKLLFHVQRFRLVSDSLALVDAVAEIKPTVASGGTPLASFVVVKQEGHWLIESAREINVHLPPKSNPLKDLQWLVGDWASTTSAGGITLRASCDWTASQAFLIRKFKVEGKEAFVHGGTEIIAWDPRSQRIRSWVFDSDGGFGENVWVRDGNHWLVKYSGTLADGSTVTATNMLIKVDDDTVTSESKERTINGAEQPDIPATSLKRQAPIATTAPTAPAITPVKPDEGTKTTEKPSHE